MRQISLVTEPPVRSASLHFAAGIPGFPHLRAFTLARWGSEESPFMTMTADQDADISFVVVSPFLYYPEYEFEIDDGTAERLGLASPDDVQVLCIITLHEKPEDATANLLGPIVVNVRNGEACQSVLPHTIYSVKAPLARAA
jgi:flagellar assembly factor FliW